MKQYSIRLVFCYLLIISFPLLTLAQLEETASASMLRVYEDNDFINLWGHSTDKAYTNGTKIDYFYGRPERSHWFIDRLFPTAGTNSINILEWNITELMFTPNDLAVTTYQSDDYPYSTALYATHGLYSYNPVKKISLQTEFMAGIRGPAAMGEQTQTFIHRLMHFQRPLGWDNQLQNKIILNIRSAVEKQLYGYRNHLDIIGGAAMEAGTFSNALTLYPLIRVGKMNPYFAGLISQYTGSKHQHGKKKTVQAYLVFKPGFTLSGSNSLLQAGRQQFNVEGKNEKLTAINHAIWFFNGGAVLSVNRIGLSFNQNMTSALVEHLYAHSIGNVSVYYGL